jgi:hypothetical protein
LFIGKIPPNLPFPKGGIFPLLKGDVVIPLFGKEGIGEIF